MLLFYLKFQNRLQSPQAQACGFFISQKHAFWTIRNRNYNPIVQKSVFLKNREGE